MNIKTKYIRKTLNVLSVMSALIILLTDYMEWFFWDLSLLSVFILMLIRPANDLFPKLKLGKYIPLRKELGILSSVIIVSFAISEYIFPEFTLFRDLFSLSSWTLEGNSLWARITEITAIILLLTSNKFSMKLLKKNWKRIQKLSYLYFFSGAWYVFAQLNKIVALIYIIIVFEITLAAYMKKKIEKYEKKN